MKKKQVIALLLAAGIFVVTGVSSVVVNTWSKKQTISMEKTYAEMFSSIGQTAEATFPEEDYVGVLNVEGTMYSSADVTSMLEGGNSYDHAAALEYVNQLMESESNEALLLYVNSPGGEVTAADDLYLKLMEYKEKTGRKIYCYFGSQACSGGYYVAMAADEIYANRNCWTGSIGVIIQLMNMEGLYDKLGIKDQSIVSGPNKAIGSATQEMTKEQKEILQGLVDEAYEQFVGIVAEGRNMDLKTVKKIADGRIYTAKQAQELGLLDGTCTKEAYEAKVLEAAGENVILHEPEKGKFKFADLFATIADLKPRSEAEIIEDLLENDRMGGLMYYADDL